MLVLVGWYGRGNCGDEAFKDVHCQLFPDSEKIWVDDKTQMPPGNNTIILGGGDVVSEFYIDKIPVKNNFFMYGVGLASPQQIEYVASIKDRLLGVWVRNEADAEALRQHGVPARFSPDIVFQLLHAVERCPRERLPAKGDRKRLLVIPSNNGAEAAVRTGNIGKYHYYEFMLIEMAKTLDYLSKYYDVMFVPMSIDQNDNDLIWAMRCFAAMKCKETTKILSLELSPMETAALIQESDMVMSMKFHGLVFSILTATPFINVGITRKTKLLCHDNGLGDLSVPAMAFSYDRVLETLKIAESDGARARIADVSKGLQHLAAAEGELFAARIRQEVSDQDLSSATT